MVFRSSHLLNRASKLWILSGAALLLSACANPYHISRNEIKAYQAYANCEKAIYTDCRELTSNNVDGKTRKVSGKTIANTVAYADDLIEYYLKTAGEAARSQDLLALGVIGAAGTVAGGSMFDPNDLLPVLSAVIS